MAGFLKLCISWSDQILWATDLGFLLKHIEHNIISTQLLSPDGAMFYCTWYRSVSCYPQISTFCCIRYRGGLDCGFSNGHKMGQDDIQLKCSTRFGGWGGFSFSFSCWIVCSMYVCARMFTHAAGIFRGHRLNPQPPGDNLVNIFVILYMWYMSYTITQPEIAHSIAERKSC